MQKFVLKELVNQDVESELEKIGFDIAYRAKASDKYRYKTLKIFDLSLPQANILKQTAISFGADCGVHRDILTANIEKTDVILGGSYSQIKKICEKLKMQPFSMKNLADDILVQLEIREKKTKLVGILNITPDSFSDGGKYIDPDDARSQLLKLIDEGADIIDIGAESTRPNSVPIDPKIQIERLRPVLRNLPDFPISVDTRSSEVARFALDCGVKIINDVSGMSFDSKMLDVIAEYQAGIVLQHSTFKSEDRPNYNNIVEDVYKDLLKKSQVAQERGLKNIILDPGIGFGKSKNDNLEILNRIEEFYSLNYPIMIGVSRKSFLGINDSADNYTKDALTLAISYPLINKKVDFLRVHNVKLHRQLLDLAI